MTATRHGYRTLGHVTGAVLVRGADRAERVGEAMRCRGFDGTFHTTAAFRTTAADIISFAASSLSLLALMSCGIAWFFRDSALSTQHSSLVAPLRGRPRRARRHVVRDRTRASAWRSWGRTGRARRRSSSGCAGCSRGNPARRTSCGLDPADPAHRKKLPAAIGIVFQNPDDQLFSPTVLDDVAFGPLNQGMTRRRGEGPGRWKRSRRSGCLPRLASACRSSFRAATSAARRWPACSPCGPRCCCSMSRARSSTRAAAAT